MVARTLTHGIPERTQRFCPIGIQSPTRQWMMVWGVLHHLRNAKYLFRFHKTSLKRWARISRVLRRLRFSGQKRCRVPRLRRCSIMTALRQCSKNCCKWSYSGETFFIRFSMTFPWGCLLFFQGFVCRKTAQNWLVGKELFFSMDHGSSKG